LQPLVVGTSSLQRQSAFTWTHSKDRPVNHVAGGRSHTHTHTLWVFMFYGDITYRFVCSKDL